MLSICLDAVDLCQIREKDRETGSDDPYLKMAPQVGLEPTTLRLTAECSAIELLRNTVAHGYNSSAVRERLL